MNTGYTVGKSLAKNWPIWLVTIVVAVIFFKWFSAIVVQPPAISSAPPVVTPLIAKPLVQSCAEILPVRLEDARLAMQRKEPKAAFDALDVCREHLNPAAQSIYKTSMADIAKTAAAQQKKSAIQAKKEASIQLAAKKREGVSIGMTEQDALDSSWGKPRKINRTTRANSVREQWVYDGGYLYFENGVLTSIQN